MKGKKGQLSFLKVFAFAIVFIIFFSLALAPLVSTMLGIANLSMLGTFGAFMIGNLNIWIILCFVLVVILALVYGVQE